MSSSRGGKYSSRADYISRKLFDAYSERMHLKLQKYYTRLQQVEAIQERIIEYLASRGIPLEGIIIPLEEDPDKAR